MRKGKGVFYQSVEEQEEEEKIEQENPKSNDNDKPVIEPQPNPNQEYNPENKPIPNDNPELENNPKLNPTNNPNYEKVKYTDSRVQRGFYYEKHLIKLFDKHWPKDKFDKSKIMNDLLREFLVRNGKI